MEKIQIDVVSDVVCPWCYVGKKRLEKALTLLEGDFSFEVNWKPFQLDPGVPPEGRDAKEHYANKFGSWEQYLEISKHVGSEGEAEGIAFDFKHIARQPNTLKAHLLVRMAEQEGKGQDATESLFKAYFTEGQLIGDTGVLLQLATELGMNTEGLAERLDDAGHLAEISGEIQAYQSLGINSVPSYIINNKYLVQGAQPPEVFVNVLRQLTGEHVHAEGGSCEDGSCGCHS